MYQVTRLNHGLRVATAEMPYMTSVSLGVWVGTGSRYEPKSLNGVCHFIEHLMFKGTRKRSAREISQAVEGVGGYLNAFTSEETTCFHCRASHTRFGELLDVLMDMLMNSRFVPADIRKEREVIKEEMAMYLDEPQHLVQELLNATLWPGQALGRPITGTNATLDGMRRGDLVGFLNSNYGAGGTVVAVAGRVRHKEVVAAVSRYARHLKARARPDCAAALATQRAPMVNLFTKKTEQTQIALGFRACSRHDERRYTLRLLNALLGENMSSRLFQVVREDRGLVYSIYSTPSFFQDTGDLVISAGLDEDKLERTLKLIARELRRLVQSPATRSELRRARDYVIGQIDLSLESTESQMNWLGEQLLGYGQVPDPDTIKARLRRVTPAEIQAVAREVFRPERLNLAVVSPIKTSDHLLNTLSSIR